MYYYINCARSADRPSLIYGSACFILTVSLPGKGGRGMEKKKKKTRSGARLLPALLVLMIGLGAQLLHNADTMLTTYFIGFIAYLFERIEIAIEFLTL